MLWHILTPRAVACDYLHLRASVQLWHVSAFLCNGEFLGISCYIKIPGYTRRGPCSNMKNPLFMLFPEKFRKLPIHPSLRRHRQMLRQYSRRHSSDAARDRGRRGGFFFQTFPEDVAAELSVLIHVDSNVDQHSAFL